MKHLFLVLCLAFGAAASQAQTFPTVPANAPANLQGQALRDWLRQNWYDGKRNVLSYSTARAKMYNYADNFNNSVTCVYSGYNTPVPLNFNSGSTTSAANINCEHTIPQSWFSSANRMVSDMHHLYPTYIQWNSNRGSNPYYDIPDANGTTTWMRNTTSQTTIPTTQIDEWSEATSNVYEPREDHKGNVARTAFYFYTMHDQQPELIATGHQAITSLSDLATLYRWHLADPVDAHEIERNRRVAASQGNYNPYILHPEYVAIAYNLMASGSVISFATASSTQTEGNNAVIGHTITLTATPAPTAPLTVQVSLDAANSTATAGTDFTFTSPTTVTFAAGQTTATVNVMVVGDVQSELDETVVLNLTNPGTGASVGSPSGHTLTITNDDGNPPTVTFASAVGRIVEGNSGTTTYSISLVMTNGTVGPVTVPVSVSTTGTTANASDYVLNTTSVSFGGIVGPQPITITINGDLTPEPDETIQLVLGAPSANGVLLGTPSTHIVTIGNDDAVPTGQPCARPFFTQYIEGSATNTKAIEIFNPTNAAMSLAGKRLELFANGAIAPTTTLALTGSIAPGDVYVIANTGVVNMAVAAQADLQHAIAFFNGDDALIMYDGTDTLDAIGIVGDRPTSWPAPGNGSTLNNTLVRQPTTTGGGRWDGPNGSATWTAQGMDDFTGIGSYTSTACNLTATRGGLVQRSGLELYPNPASETLRLRLPGLATTQAATIEVLDNLGRVLRQRPAMLSATDAAQLDLRGLPAGLYAVRVTTAAGQYAGRVVVQ